MDDRTKLAVAVLGGYAMGRTKHLGAAIGLLMFLRRTDGAQRLMANPQVQEIADQVTGPLLEAATEAATTFVLGRLTDLTGRLADRAASAAGETVEGVADTVADTVTDTVSGLVGRRGRRKPPEPEEETDDEEEEPDEAEPEDDEDDDDRDEEPPPRRPRNPLRRR